tara:strand:- start:7990 stop:8847 length:858 start_codon:yes stop_codon:yes gene_type:complete
MTENRKISALEAQVMQGEGSPYAEAIVEAETKAETAVVEAETKAAMAVEKMLTTNDNEFASSYSQIFYTGDNIEQATDFGNFITDIHSRKIKSGNELESFIVDDFKANCVHGESHVHGKKEKITIENLADLPIPCLVPSCRFFKLWYEEHGEICKNKKSVEVDFVFIDENRTIHLIELKNGCDFDTKKSKGEVQSLTATKNACLSSGFPEAKAYIVCYDAMKRSDMIVKTELGCVKLMLFEEMAVLVGITSGSRQRINLQKQIKARENIEKVMEFCRMMCDKYDN